MSTQKLLTISQPQLFSTLRSFASQMDTDDELRQAFVERPATVTGRLLSAPDQVSDTSAGWQKADTLLLAMVSNPEFRQDLHTTFSSEATRPQSREKMIETFSDLVARHADADITRAAVRFDPQAFAVVEFVVAVFVAAVVSAAVVATLTANDSTVLDARQAQAITRQLLDHAANVRARNAGA